MIKSFIEEFGYLILIVFIIFLIYAAIFGSSFHYKLPGDQAFEDFDAKAIGSFLFFYPVLFIGTFLVYFVRALLNNYSEKMLNNFTFALNVLAILFPFLAWYYTPGLEAVIFKKAPHYDSFLLPIGIVKYSIFPIFILLFYNAHIIPIANEENHGCIYTYSDEIDASDEQIFLETDK